MFCYKGVQKKNIHGYPYVKRPPYKQDRVSLHYSQCFVLKLKPCSHTGKSIQEAATLLATHTPLKSLPICLTKEKAPPCCGHHSARQVHTLSRKRDVYLQNLQTWLAWNQVICRSNQVKMRSYSIQMGPNPNQVLLLFLWKEKRHGDMQEKWQGDRDWRDAFASQRMPAAPEWEQILPKSHKKG